MSEQYTRLFFALSLDTGIVRSVTNASRSLSNSQFCRLVPRQRLHITLLFLGDVPLSYIPELLSFKPKSLPISIGLGKASIFPEKGRVGVYTINIKEARQENSKQNSVYALQHELAEFCMHNNTTRFRPHITVAYAKRSPKHGAKSIDVVQTQLAALKKTWLSTPVQFARSTISHCVLFESRQVAGERQYIPLKYYEL